MKVMLALEAKGQDKTSQDIGKVQKSIDDLKKKSEELKKQIAEQQKLGLDTTAAQKSLSEVTGEMRLLQKETTKTSEDLKALADRALIDNLKDMTGVFGGISSTVISFGKDLVSAAMQAENFKVALGTAFQGNQEAADKMLAWAKQFANETPFETNEIIQATIKLKAYGIEAEKIPSQMKLIGDMASGMGKSMDQAVEAIADARTGELERLKEFGITKKMIDDQLHGTLVNSQGQIKDTSLLMEGLTQLMEKRFAGGMEKASKTTAGQLSNVRGEFQTLKEELGSELLPAVNKAGEGLLELVKYVRSLPPEVRNTTLTFTAWAGGIALAGQGVTGFLSAAAPFKVMMDSLGAKIITATGSTAALGSSMSAFATTLPVVAVGVLVIALGALAYAYTEVLKEEAKFKQNDISEDLKKRADALKGVADSGMKATNAQGAFNEITEKGIKALKEDAQGLDKVKATQKLLVDEEMRYKDLRTTGQKDLVSIEEQLQEAKKGTLQLITDETGMNKQITVYDTEKIKTLQQQYNEQKKITDGYTEKINKVQSEKKELINIRTELEKTATVEKKAVETAKEKAGITDSDFNKKLSYYKDDINHLREYWNTYKLTYTQQLELTEAIQKIKDKNAKEEQKNLTEQQKKEQKIYTEKIKSYDEYVKLQEQEKQKRIEVGQYIIELEKKQQEDIKASFELKQNILNLEDASIEGRLLRQQQLLDLEKAQGEELKLRFDSGQKLSEQELTILQTYLQDKKVLQDLNTEYSGLIDKAAQSQRQEIENYKTYEQILVKTGKITQAEADKAMGFFEKRVSDSWKNYITPIIKQATEQGYNSLNEMQKKALGSAKDFVKANITVTDNLTTGMDNVTDSTNRAADAAAKIGSNLKSSVEQADSLAGKMQTIGNITAAKGGGTPSGLGEFMSVEEAFSNLPGSGKSPMGTSNRVTDVDKAIQESFNQAAANANTMDNPYLVTESTPYSGLGQMGYDNPVNDAGARKFGSNLIKKVAMPIITQSLKDMISHTLSGMVSTVSNNTNQTSYNNSQSSNTQSTNITNYYNNTLNNQQLNQSSPLARKTNDLADMLNLRFGRQA